MGNIDIPSFRTARGKLVRIAAFLARRMRDGMRVNLHGVADSNRKKRVANRLATRNSPVE